MVCFPSVEAFTRHIFSIPIRLFTKNMEFIQVLNAALEFIRVVDVLEFRPPPPEYTFRSLEPLYTIRIQYYQQLCEEKYAETTTPEIAEDGDDQNLREHRFAELEGLLEKHSITLSLSCNNTINHLTFCCRPLYKELGDDAPLPAPQITKA